MSNKFDESHYPERMLSMATEYLTTGKDQMIMNSPFHKKKILFFSGSYAPYCTCCENSLIVVKQEGYNDPVSFGYCDKCNLSWQVHYLSIPNKATPIGNVPTLVAKNQSNDSLKIHDSPQRIINNPASSPISEGESLHVDAVQRIFRKNPITPLSSSPNDYVKLVIEQTGCSEQEAKNALDKTNGDVVEAILSFN